MSPLCRLIVGLWKYVGEIHFQRWAGDCPSYQSYQLSLSTSLTYQSHPWAGTRSLLCSWLPTCLRPSLGPTEQHQPRPPLPSTYHMPGSCVDSNYLIKFSQPCDTQNVLLLEMNKTEAQRSEVIPPKSHYLKGEGVLFRFLFNWDITYIKCTDLKWIAWWISQMFLPI